MRGTRTLAWLGSMLLLVGEAAHANPIPVLGPSARLSSGLGVMRLRPWRVQASTTPAASRQAGVIGEGGEIILSMGSVLPWNAFSPPVATPISPPTPIVQPTPAPTAPTRFLGGFDPAPTVATTAVAPVAGSGLGVLSPAAPTPASSTFDALINFGTGPYAAADHLTGGGATAWYNSPVVQNLYGGRMPTAAEQASFTQSVLADVKQTYLEAGLDVSLTTDPNSSAAHTMSVVSGAGFPGNDKAIGISDMGGDGFSFVDKFTDAKNLDQLEVSMAKNIAHELMHSFGVDHHDKSGQYLDAPSNTWSLLYDRNTTFGPEATADLAKANFLSRYDSMALAGLQEAGHDHDAMEVQAVPEPTTIALWSLAAIGAISYRRRTKKAA